MRYFVLKGARELLAADVAPARAATFLARLVPQDGHLLYAGARNPDGYGVVKVGHGQRGRVVLAHRLAIALATGVCPADLVVDRMCYVRPCCNVAHLRLVEPEENTPAIYNRNRPPATEPTETDEVPW